MMVAKEEVVAGAAPLASEATIKQDRDRLVALQAKVDQARHIQSQLQQIAAGGTTAQASQIQDIPRQQWRTAAASSSTHANSGKMTDKSLQIAHAAATEIQNDGRVMVPLGRVAFVPGRIQHSTTESTSVLVNGGKVAFGDDNVGKHASLVERPASQILAEVNAERQRLEVELTALRDSVLATARTMLLRHLEEGKEGGTGTVTDESEQALNEEGLPFVDLNEPEVPATSQAQGYTASAPLLPLQRDAKSRAERKAWIDHVLDDIEKGGDGVVEKNQEEEAAVESQHAVEDAFSSSPSKRATIMHNRVPSSERPPPMKSVLKPSSFSITPIPKFGHSGLKNGFLNLNPSSPAAVHSSDPVEDIKWDEEGGMSGSTSSLGSAAERLSRTSETTPQKKKKKSVRIKSPDARERATPNSTTQLSAPLRAAMATESKARMHVDRDEDTAKEAEQILDLLGTDIMKGHPDYEAIMEAKRLQDEANAASAKRAVQKYSVPTKGISSGPAIRRDVMERASASEKLSPQLKESTSSKHVSAFRRGFLNGVQPRKTPPTRDASTAIPSAPQISQGVSALERATRSDDVLSEVRQQQGLTPSVPHARPSKAFAEKMEARRRGNNSESSAAADDEEPAKMSKVRFGTDVDGSVAVKVGAAATESTRVAESDGFSSSSLSEGEDETGEDDEDAVSDADSRGSSQDEELRALGLQVREEELDDETVEALGYFSDPDLDPDIGFDSDDLVDSAPNFFSDSADITDEELRREYERAKAAVLRSQGMRVQRIGNDASYDGNKELNDEYDDEDEDLAAMEGTDLSLHGADAEDFGAASGQSRFRRERIRRALQGQAAKSRELHGHPHMDADQEAQNLPEGARNVGPSMLIPSLANVRFPRNTEAALANRTDNYVDAGESGMNVELDGESDEEDDQLLDVMRARLAQRDFLKANALDDQGKATLTSQVADGDGPPTIRAKETGKDGADRDTAVGQAKEGREAAKLSPSSNAMPTKETQKKPSLFKARMQQQQ